VFWPIATRALRVPRSAEKRKKTEKNKKTEKKQKNGKKIIKKEGRGGLSFSCLSLFFLTSLFF
jgi:hypothetical protein